MLAADDASPAEGSVDQATGGRADEEFIVRGKLPDAQRHAVVEGILLEPGGEQARRRQRIDIARIGNRTNIVRRSHVADIVDLVDCEMGGGAIPADEFLQISTARVSLM
jgi:hypothetical protein